MPRNPSRNAVDRVLAHRRDTMTPEEYERYADALAADVTAAVATLPPLTEVQMNRLSVLLNTPAA